MCYVPWQTWKNVYDAANGLQKGTIFGDLVFPFLYANPACRENCNVGRRGDFR
ncbi:MAG: spore coat associated protein CotJA [Acetivibrio sp.]